MTRVIVLIASGVLYTMTLGRTLIQFDIHQNQEEIYLSTPKKYFFSIGIEVSPGSKWNCWIEMNLAGDLNESYPEFNEYTLTEDEFMCGLPALLYKTEINATGGLIVEPVSDGITTAKNVFDIIKIR